MVREKGSIANGRRLQTSNFYVMINSNMRVKIADKLSPLEKSYYERFEHAWKDYFEQSPDVWLKFLKSGDTTENSIKSIEIDGRSELQSSVRSMIHAHMLISIKHFTKIHLDTGKLRDHMHATMGNHIHINNVIPGKSPEDLQRIRAYIRKEDIEEKAELIDESAAR